MKVVGVIFLLCGVSLTGLSQDKRGYSFIFGGDAITAKFDGSSSIPTTSMLYPFDYTHRFWTGGSMICDSISGNLKFSCNGMILYDSLGNVMDNGADLQPYKITHHNSTQEDVYTQGSLILPKGSNNLYYLFTNTITDSSYNAWTSQSTKFPFDLLQYHIIDMNANNGLGSVIQKNIPLLHHVDLDKVGMMACRHANGYDWWLIKQNSYDTMVVYKILVTADTVIVKDTQRIENIKFGVWDNFGQSCFSSDGKKFAFVMGRTSQLFIADFNRCTAEFTNCRTVKIPMDSTTHPALNAAGVMDSTIGGVCFSGNNEFVYVTRQYNIYQYDLFDSDSNSAWFRIKHGEDTAFIYFEYYGPLKRGIDDRIYIGKGGNTSSSNSVINSPNLKGAACNFCRKCLRYDIPNTHTLAPLNMPDFLLGLDSTSCWPVTVPTLVKEKEEFEVYPNPAHNKLYFKTTNRELRELYNALGVRLLFTKQDEMDVSSLSFGVYYVKVGNGVRKVVIK